MKLEDYEARHLNWSVEDGVAQLVQNRPEKKNPLTFDSYHEIRDIFGALRDSPGIRVVVVSGAGGNFCSGGDVHEIIGPLVETDMPGLLAFTRLTGDVVKSMRACPQPVIAAIDGICAGAGAAIAMAADLRYGTPGSKVAFLFARVGLAGADMGACAILPRLIGQGRTSELLLTGRAMTAQEALAWGFYNEVVGCDDLLGKATETARRLAQGPTFAHAMTKNQLNVEWNMGLDSAIEAEAQAQAICMQTRDFERAYRAFVAKEKPQFEGD